MSARCIRRPESMWSDCRCEDCRVRALRLAKLVRTGRHQRARSEEAWARIELLLAGGWGTGAIAAACGVHRQQISGPVRDRARGRQRRWGHAMSRRILAIDPAVTPPGGSVSVVGSRRRLQALACLGWSPRAIADAVHDAGLEALPCGTLHSIRNGQVETTIRAPHAAAVRAAYRLLSNTKAPAGRSATQAIAHAAERGWATPAAWNDEDLDDPAAQPFGTVPADTRRGPRWQRRDHMESDAVDRAVDGDRPAHARRLSRDERRLAVARLHARGFCAEQIAARVGYSDRTVQRDLEYLASRGDAAAVA